MAQLKHRLISMGALAGLMVLAGCNKAPSGSAATIPVGEFASLTGKEATFGQSSHKGTAMAFEEINAAGGVLGKKVDLLTEDNASKQGESATIAKKLISRDHIVALLGEVASGRSLEAAPICQAAKIPMVSPASTNPAVTQKGDYIFRVCFIDPFQGAAMAKFAATKLGMKKVAVFSCLTSPYSAGLSKFFKAKFTAGGGAIALEETYSDGDKDFKAQLTAIKAANVDGIFVPGYYSEVGLICSQARELGITVPLLGGDGWEAPQLLTIGGAAVNGCYYTTHFSPQNQDPAVQGFVARFKARWNGEVPDAMAALGYDSAGVLANAIKRAGSTEPAALRGALAGTKDYPGITGSTTIGPDRNAQKAAAVIMVKDGTFRFLQTIAP
jgi:branched-chain amino acid transport system substrate-binding protein